MAFLVCSNCDIYYEIHAKKVPSEIGVCNCGQKLQFYQSLEDYLREKGKIRETPSIDYSLFNEFVTNYETSIAQMVLVSVGELPFSVGVHKLIEVLRGSRSTFILDNNLHQLITYSVFSNFKKDILEHMIHHLVDFGYLVVKHNPDNYDILP